MGNGNEWVGINSLFYFRHDELFSIHEFHPSQGSIKESEFSRIRKLLEKGGNDAVSADSLPKWFSYLLELYSQISEVESLAVSKMANHCPRWGYLCMN